MSLDDDSQEILSGKEFNVVEDRDSVFSENRAIMGVSHLGYGVLRFSRGNDLIFAPRAKRQEGNRL